MYFHWHANTFLLSHWKSIVWNGEESGYVTKPLEYAHFRTLEDKETDKYQANNFANPRQINRQILNANQSLSQPVNVMFNRKTDRNWIIYLIRECRSSCIRLIERVKLYHCMSARVFVCVSVCIQIFGIHQALRMVITHRKWDYSWRCGRVCIPVTIYCAVQETKSHIDLSAIVCAFETAVYITLGGVFV